MSLFVTFVVTFTAFLIALYAEYYPRNGGIPKHFLDLPARGVDDLIEKDVAKELQNLFKEMRTFANNIDQSRAQGFQPAYESIGEDQPINPDGTCPYALLFPNSNKTACILPQRVDVGKHFMMTGGMDGVKELPGDLIDRVSSFARYNFLDEVLQIPSVKALFESPQFQDGAREVCPNNMKYLDTFQFNFIIQVPGQSVALHIDAPYFWGASRFHFPQWLLAVMAYSGLFKEQFVNQVQVVGYLHEWENGVTEADGGQFVYFKDEGDMGVISPEFRAGTFIDGSKLVHAAQIYRPHVKAPHLPKDEICDLTYIDNEDWVVKCDGRTVAEYKTADLRISVVYRARCFNDAEEAERFKTQLKAPPSENMNLEVVLNKLKDEMVANRGFSAEKLNAMSRLELANTLMDTFIYYPLPPKEKAWFPLNYCALPLLAPWTESIMKFICN